MNTKTTVNEPARNLPVSASYDLVVAGAGIAGVAAAVAAARNNISVCLIDKASAAGGLATLGNVSVWLPICDGNGRQVIGGLAEELLRLSVADIPHDDPTARFHQIPECWQKPPGRAERKTKRFQVNFNPASYMFALEKLVVDEGVELIKTIATSSPPGAASPPTQPCGTLPAPFRRAPSPVKRQATPQR